MERVRLWELSLIVACVAVSSIATVHEPRIVLLLILILGLMGIYVAARAALTSLLFLSLSVGGATLSSLTGVASGSTLLSALVLGCILCIGMAMGFRRPPLSALLAVSVFVIWGLTWAVLPDRVGRSLVDWLGSMVGYIVPWLLLFINWKKVSTRFVAIMIALAPLFAVIVGFGLDVAGVKELTDADALGTSRLAGGLPAAYMGSLAGFGMIAAMWLWLRRNGPGMLLLILDGLVLVSTLARGPLLVASLVVLTLILFAKRTRTRIAFIARSGALSLFVVGLAYVFPRVIARTQGQDEYQGGLSGRELAWEYFWRTSQERPVFGYGPGAHATLSQQSDVALVREYFVAPHNTYLQLLVDFGFVGTAAIVVAIIWLFAAVARRQERTERVLLYSMGFALAIYAYFDNVLSVPQVYVPVFTLIGILRVAGAGNGGPASGVNRYSPLLQNSPPDHSGSRPRIQSHA